MHSSESGDAKTERWTDTEVIQSPISSNPTTEVFTG